jgi:hypothetical protein
MIYYILDKIKKIFRLVVPSKFYKVIKVKVNTHANLNNSVDLNINKKLISNYHEDCSYNNLQKLNKLRQRN